MTSLVLTPVLHQAEAVELGNGLWRKRVLPVGDVAYMGRTLHFTLPYLRDLVKSFSQRAYDQVPFQLADTENRHTNDPERTRGHVVDMDADESGLWITAKVNEAGEQVLAANPDLGISARIVEDYSRSDGRHFTAAIQHVLGTLDPRIPGLGAWEPVEASNTDVGTVVDLSASAWVGEPGPEADPLANMDAELAAAVAGMSDEEFAELVAEFEAEQVIGDMEENPGAYGLLPAGEADVTEHANSYDLANPRTALDLANATHALELADMRAALHLAEEAGPAAQAPRGRPGFEVKMARALSRAARGTLAPQPGVMGFANGSEAGRALAALRWQQDQAGPGLCGPADPLGNCASPTHFTGCPGLGPDPDEMAVLSVAGVMDAIAGEQAEDARGRTWTDQNGQPMSLTAHVEAALGLRLGTPPDGLFETGKAKRDLVAPYRPVVFGDPDSGEPGTGIPGDTEVQVMTLKHMLGLGGRTAADARESGRRQRDAMMTRLALQRGNRGVHPDYHGESTRDRAARLKADVVPVPVGDPEPGALPAYTLGGAW